MEHISDFKDDRGVLVADYDGLNMKEEMNPNSELGGILMNPTNITLKDRRSTL
jgi:hypothetical protein